MAPIGKNYLFSLGQAGFVIKTKSGKYIGVDMYLSDCVERMEGSLGVKRLLPKILAPKDILFDYVITTHPHRDHFDEDSISQLMENGKTKLFASLNCEQDVEALQIDKNNCRFVKPGEQFTDGEIVLHFVLCDHGKGAPDAFGVVVELDSMKLFFAGDTCLRKDKISYFKQFGDIDILIAPINGAWGNMDESDCAEFAKELQAKLTIPCHYGMFASHGGNPGLFCEFMAKKCPNNKVLLMAQGECLKLENL